MQLEDNELRFLVENWGALSRESRQALIMVVKCCLK